MQLVMKIELVLDESIERQLTDRTSKKKMEPFMMLSTLLVTSHTDLALTLIMKDVVWVKLSQEHSGDGTHIK